MKVSDLMSNSVISVAPDTSAAAAAKLLAKHNIGSVPVVGGDGRIRGIVTDRDIVTRCIAYDNNPFDMPVSEIMTRGVLGVSPDADIREATKLMSSEQVRRLPVIDNGKIIGVISLGDMAQSNAYQLEISKALTEISMPEK